MLFLKYFANTFDFVKLVSRYFLNEIWRDYFEVALDLASASTLKMVTSSMLKTTAK